MANEAAWRSGDDDAADDADLVAVWRLTWRSKYLIAFFVVVSAAAAVVLALTATPEYRAEVVVTEARQNGMNAASSLANQLGGLASIAGINLDSANNGNHEALAELHSRRMIEEFIQTKSLIRVLLPHSKKPPTLWLAVKAFQEGILTVRDDKRNALTTVAIEWEDPAVAAQWANEFVGLANDRVRARAIADSTRNIAYLNKQIAETNVVELQRVMYNLIETETKTLMLANGRAEYAFRVIDPAVPPEVKSSPHRILMVLVGILIGLAVGLVIAWLRPTLARMAAATST